VASNFVDQPRFLFAVAQTDRDPTGSQYAVYFGSASDPGTTDVEVIGDAAGRTAFIGEAGIVKVDFGCGDGVGKEAASHPKTGYILAPRTAPGPPGTGSGTGAHPTQSPLWMVDVRVALGVTLASVLVLVALKRHRLPVNGRSNAVSSATVMPGAETGRSNHFIGAASSGRAAMRLARWFVRR